MDVDRGGNELYVRCAEDVKAIIKHAKLDEKNLTQITQAIYFPSEQIVSDNLKLLELDDHIHKQIREGQNLYFKGGLNEKVVLCTDERTYDVKEAEISNSLLLIQDLKFAAATSTSPLKSPKNANNSADRSLNDSLEDDVNLNTVLEHRKVVKIFHEYIECREIRPRFRKLGDLLQLTRYSGPENEYCIDKKLLFTFDQLLNTIQCSRKQFIEGLQRYRAIELDGYMRMLEYNYEYRIVNVMVGLIAENSWELDEIVREETISSLEGIAPKEIVESLFDLYTIPSEKSEKFKYLDEHVARIVAQNILQPGLKFRIDEFMNTWKEALPDGLQCDEKYLRGLGIVDRDSSTQCVRSLAEQNLPTNMHERLKILFKTKPRWTMEEMEPYMEYFTTPALSVSVLLAKYARSLTVNSKRYYVAKHI